METPHEEKRPHRSLTKAEQRCQATRQRRLARYQKVVGLHEQGMTERSIAHEAGVSRRTVRRYLTAGSFPEMSKRRKRASILDPYMPYLGTLG